MGVLEIGYCKYLAQGEVLGVADTGTGLSETQVAAQCIVLGAGRGTGFEIRMGRRPILLSIKTGRSIGVAVTVTGLLGVS